MKAILFFITIFFSALHLQAQMPDDIIIKKTLAEQTTAWNAGNLDKFMDGYWQSDSLMFIGNSGPSMVGKTH